MSSNEVALGVSQIYWWCVLGIVISILLPILRGLLPRPANRVMANAAAIGFASALWEHAKPDIVVGLFSLITAVLIIAFTYSTVRHWRAALIADYAWDSTLHKLTRP